MVTSNAHTVLVNHWSTKIKHSTGGATLVETMAGIRVWKRPTWNKWRRIEQSLWYCGTKSEQTMFFGRKSSLSQHTVGPFPWAHCKPTNADTGGLPMRPKHIRRDEAERGKKDQMTEEENILYVFLQVTMQL